MKKIKLSKRVIKKRTKSTRAGKTSPIRQFNYLTKKSRPSANSNKNKEKEYPGFGFLSEEINDD